MARRPHRLLEPRTRPRAQRALTVVLLFASVLATSVGGSTAASQDLVVSAQVLSASNLDVTGCPTAARTFGTVLPDSSVVTAAPCTVTFGSTNNSSMLKMYQSDTFGDAMFANSDGSLDATFSGDGKDVVTFPGGSLVASGFTQADGKVVLIGYSNPSTDQDASVARIDPDTGMLDGSFGVGGRAVISVHLTDGDRVRAGIQQPDGKLLFVGSLDVFSGLNNDVALIRLNADGTPDATFGGGDGIVTWNVQGLDEGYDVDIAGGRIYVTGLKGTWNDGTTQDGFISRLYPDGTLDSAWGSGGTVLVDTNPGASDRTIGATFLPSGKIMVHGRRHNGSDEDLVLARLLSDGSLDNTYGTGGSVTVSAGPGVDDSTARSQIDPSTGEALIAGYQGPLAGPVGWVRRYRGDGTLDTTWASNGVASFSFGAGRTGSIYGMWSPDMRTVYAVGANQTASPDKDFSAVKILPSGTVQQLGTAGRIDFNGDNDYGNAVFPGRDGALFGVGPAANAGVTDMGIVKFAPGGTIPDYGGGAVFGSADTQSAFGACLEARSGSGVGGGWALDPGGSCTAVVGDPWNPIADTASDATAKVLGSPTSGVVDASASIRFGIKTALATPAMSYSAPITIDVVAPNA